MKINIRDIKERQGPGNNYFKEENVISANNEIILKISKINNEFTCAEVFSEELGFGKYECEVELPFIVLPKGIVFGFFLYKDDKNEVDIELSRWNKTFFYDSNFAIQDYNGKCKTIRMLNLKKNNKISIEWRKDFVEFKLNNKIERINYSNDNLGALHINLWIYGKQNSCEVKVRNLKYSG